MSALRPRKKKPKKKNEDIVQWIWLKQQLEEINRKLNLILAELEGKTNINPELEYQIKRASVLARQIDSKVPDNPTQKKG